MTARMNVGLICNYDRRKAKTIEDHIAAILAIPHNVTILRIWDPPMAWRIDLNLFDVLIVHYDVVASVQRYIPPIGRSSIAAFKGLKIIFIQDEYRWVDKTVEAIREMRFDVLFTCVPEQEIEKVYPREKLPGLRKINVLTGYVPTQLLGRKTKPYDQRAIEVGYRSRKLPAWLGELAVEKWRIVDRFRSDAERFGLRTDLSYREEDRIYGEGWYRVIENCRAVLGTESGASVFDFSGEVQAQAEAYERANPDASFEEISQKYFAHLEGNIKLNQISPRCFEAICLRALLILYEGDYSGVLRPWRHYVPLKKDHSNIAEVVAALRNPQVVSQITERAYQEIACNPEWSYRALTAKLTEAIREGVELDEGARANYSSDDAPVMRKALAIRLQLLGKAVAIRVQLARKAIPITIQLERNAIAIRVQLARKAIAVRVQVERYGIVIRVQMARKAMAIRVQLVRNGVAIRLKLARKATSVVIRFQLGRSSFAVRAQLAPGRALAVGWRYGVPVKGLKRFFKTLLVRMALFFIGLISNRRAIVPVDTDEALAEAPELLLAAWTRFRPLLAKPAIVPGKPGLRRRNSIIFIQGTERPLDDLAVELRSRGWDALAVAIGPWGELLGDVSKSSAGRIRCDPSARESRMRRLAAEIRARFSLVVISGPRDYRDRNDVRSVVVPKPVIAHLHNRPASGTGSSKCVLDYRTGLASRGGIYEALLLVSQNGKPHGIEHQTERAICEQAKRLAADKLEETYDAIVGGSDSTRVELFGANIDRSSLQ